MLGVRIESAIEKSLDNYVRKSGSTRSAVVKAALCAYLAEKEDQERHDDITLAAWKDVQNGFSVSEKTVLDTLKTWKCS